MFIYQVKVKKTMRRNIRRLSVFEMSYLIREFFKNILETYPEGNFLRADLDDPPEIILISDIKLSLINDNIYCQKNKICSPTLAIIGLIQLVGEEEYEKVEKEAIKYLPIIRGNGFASVRNCNTFTYGPKGFEIYSDLDYWKLIIEFGRKK